AVDMPAQPPKCRFVVARFSGRDDSTPAEAGYYQPMPPLVLIYYAIRQASVATKMQTPSRQLAFRSAVGGLNASLLRRAFLLRCQEMSGLHIEDLLPDAPIRPAIPPLDAENHHRSPDDETENRNDENARHSGRRRGLHGRPRQHLQRLGNEQE